VDSVHNTIITIQFRASVQDSCTYNYSLLLLQLLVHLQQQRLGCRAYIGDLAYVRDPAFIWDPASIKTSDSDPRLVLETWLL